MGGTALYTRSRVGQPLRTEVAHTNGSDLSIFIEFLKGAPRTVIVAVWLVNEIQIDIVKLQYARSLLMQEESMIEQIREYDRKKRTISVGSCTPVLIPDFVSLLSSLYEGMTISTEVTGDPHLAEQLRENKYQLVIFHEEPDAEDFYSLPIESEHLYVLLPPVHPLADADGLYLKDLDGQTFLLYSQIGFWTDCAAARCRPPVFSCSRKWTSWENLWRTPHFPHLPQITS